MAVRYCGMPQTRKKRLILQLAQLADLELETLDNDGVSALGQARKIGNIEIVALLQAWLYFRQTSIYIV